MKKLWQAIKNPFLTTVFVLLGIFLYSNYSYLLPFGAHPVNKDALFTADGTAEVTYVPDTAFLYLGVNKTAATQDEAKNEANKVINQITADLKKLGIDEKNIKTTNFSVNQNYGYEIMPVAESGTTDSKAILPPRPTTSGGYIASANLEVRVKPLEKADKAIDVATKDGATQVGTSQLTLDEQKQKQLEDQARIEAINNAKDKAKEISKAAGIRLGRVVSVQENNGGFARPYLMTKSADNGGVRSTPTTEIQPGENKISITVTLSYETY